MSVEPERMDLKSLQESCQRESSSFFKDGKSDDRFCYELFRRAIKLGNRHAWDTIWDNYINLVRGWVRRNSLVDAIDMPLDELVSISYERFWLATSRLSFDRFPNLQSLLQYLYLCCNSAVLDVARQAKRNVVAGSLDQHFDLSDGKRLERTVALKDQRKSVWDYLHDTLSDESERVVVNAYFVLGLAPREIFAEYRSYFDRIEDVYRIKRNVMSRLRNDTTLRELLDAL